MRILALVTDGYGSNGGIARYNADLFAAMSSIPAIKDVLIVPRFGDSRVPTPPNIRQTTAYSAAFLWAGKAIETALRSDFNLIFCGHMNIVPFAALLAKVTKRPLWVQAHGIEAWQDRGPYFRKALSGSALVTAVSRHTRRRLLSWADLDPITVRVLPNTFDHSYSPRDKQDSLLLRYGLRGKKVILTVGRMSSAEQYKGHDRIIQCLGSIRDAVPNVAYLVVGTGDDRARLEELARSLGFERSIVFAGHVPSTELPNHYALGDVFVLPSTGEGFGIVFLEAAAAGLPVIGGNRDGSLDPLADGEVGTPVETDDLAELSRAIITALTEKRATKSSEYTRFASTHFSIHTKQLIELLSEQLGA